MPLDSQQNPLDRFSRTESGWALVRAAAGRNRVSAFTGLMIVCDAVGMLPGVRDVINDLGDADAVLSLGEEKRA